MAQTREADLYAQSGTRNYWQPEAIPYAQGSDHDVFLGLGIPATMFGHDPDWTHHTSEDKIDKTDASEFRRVGVFASASTYFLGIDDPSSQPALRKKSAPALLPNSRSVLPLTRLSGQEVPSFRAP